MYFKETPNRYMVFRDSGAILVSLPKNRTSSMWSQGNAVHYVYRGMHYTVDRFGRKSVYKDPKKRSVFNKNYKPGTYSTLSDSVATPQNMRAYAESLGI